MHAHEPHKLFWEKFAADAPSLVGKRVLEIGCGLGERSFETARKGAASVLGIDRSETSIAEAQARLSASTEESAKRVEFRLCQVEDIPDGEFDIIMSEDVFEHIVDPAAALAHIRPKLKPGGYLFLGFGPLYHSPFGDHGWIQEALPTGRFPWAHLFLPDRILFPFLTRKWGKPARDTVDWPYLALNQYTVQDFERLFAESGMRTVSYQNERHDRTLAGKLFDVLGRLPVLRKYCTAGIYTVLQR